MDTFKGLVVILMSSVLVNNYVLNRFLGICPFLGVSKKLNQAVGMGISVIFVMLVATAVTWPIQTFILEKTGLEYTQTIVFILVIAALVQFIEIVLKKFIPSLHKSLGVYLPLITTNCAVLGVTINNITDGFNFLESMVSSLGCGLGFLLAMATIREIFGAGTFAGIEIPFLVTHKIEILVKAPGGLMVYGLLIAVVNVLTKGKLIKKKEFSCAGCPSAGVCHGGCEKSEKEDA